MNLYLDDKLVSPDADAPALEAALTRFKSLGHRRLKLGREPKRSLTLSRWLDDLFVEVETPQGLEGIALGGWAEAVRLARDYFEGKAVRLAWAPFPGAASVVVGDAYHPDCPLCRKGL